MSRRFSDEIHLLHLIFATEQHASETHHVPKAQDSGCRPNEKGASNRVGFKLLSCLRFVAFEVNGRCRPSSRFSRHTHVSRGASLDANGKTEP